MFAGGAHRVHNSGDCYISAHRPNKQEKTGMVCDHARLGLRVLFCRQALTLMIAPTV